jgi:hypothetical protein
MTGTEQAPKDLFGFLDFYLVKKAPFQIPDGAREVIVKYGPWVLVVLLVLSLPAVLFILGVGTAIMPFGGYGYATGFGFAAILLIVHLGLMAAALPGLFARKMSGWRLMFYSEAINIVHSLLIGAILAALVGGLIGLYILFQIRPLYRE